MTAPPFPRPRNTSSVALALTLRRDPLELVRRLAAECRDIGGFSMGPRQILLVNSPELVGEVLTGHPEDFGKGEVQLRALRPLMGNGLLSSEGELHRRQRKLVAPAFVPRRVERYVTEMNELTESMIDGWSEGAELDLLAEFNALTMDLVGKLLLSSSLRKDTTLAAAVTEAFEWEMYAMTRLVPLPISVPTPRNLRMRRALAHLHRKLGDVITERRSGSDTGDVLSLLLAARDEDGNPMSDRQLLDEVITLTGAAQETSADGQAWTMYLLATQPEVRERLRSEVDEVLGDGPVTGEQVRKLPYAMQVYKEALRLYPPAAIMMRSAITDTTIGGYRVPRGTVVLISPYGLHRRPDAFPDPERFDPDRFAKEKEKNLPKHAFLPFGGGQNVCVGSHLALLEGQVLTATLARRVEFELVSGQQIDPVLLVNLRPRNGIRVRVRKRTDDRATASALEEDRS